MEWFLESCNAFGPTPSISAYSNKIWTKCLQLLHNRLHVTFLMGLHKYNTISDTESYEADRIWSMMFLLFLCVCFLLFLPYDFVIRYPSVSLVRHYVNVLGRHMVGLSVESYINRKWVKEMLSPSISVGLIYENLKSTRFSFLTSEA